MDCPRCGEHYSNKSNLLAHLRKTVSCVVRYGETDIGRHEIINQLLQKPVKENKLNCEQCKKEFNTRQAKHKHTKICNTLPESGKSESGKSESGKSDFGRPEPKLKQVDEPKQIVSQNSINISGDVNNSQINNINITINGLGLENKDYLTKELIENLFSKRVEGLLDILKKKHLNLNYPENINIRKKVHSNNFIEAYDGSEWISRHKSYVLKDVFSHIGKDLVQFINSTELNFDTLSEENQVRLYHSFMDNVGLPLDWCLLLNNTDLMKDFMKTYHVDFSNYTKRKNLIYGIASESIYDFSKKSKECPF